MSRLLSSASIIDARPLSMGEINAPVATGFRARFADGQEHSSYIPRSGQAGHGAADFEAPVDPAEQALADAFAQGFEAGARTTRESFEERGAAMDRLAQAIDQLRPVHCGELSSMISAAVLRLVSQIAGNAPVDAAVLQSRVEAVAAFMQAERGRDRLRVHPDDIALLAEHDLAAELTPDPTLARGSVRLDTADGWIEDGPDVQLAKLKALLDDMEGQL